MRHDALETLVGKRVSGVAEEDGWPYILFEDGTCLQITAAWRSEVCLELKTPEHFGLNYLREIERKVAG